MGYYDSIAAGYNELHAEEQLKKLERIKQWLKQNKIPITKDTRLLDVGCGTGISTDFWDCDAVGIDPSKELIAKNTKFGKKSTLIHGHAENLPFEDHSFDIVISVTAIQNFQDIELGLKEIKRVGKQRFVLSFLKKSPKSQQILKQIKGIFNIREILEEDKDFIVFV